MQALVSAYRAPGARPDYPLFDSMIRYIENVPDRIHHPKEDATLFPAVIASGTDGRDLVAKLERDHADGPGMLGDLRRAFEACQRGEPNALNRLSTALDEFTEFYWSHMRMEEEELLPLAVKTLSEQQWDEVSRAFSDSRDPLFDAAMTEEYRALYKRIAELAPKSVRALLESVDS